MLICERDSFEPFIPVSQAFEDIAKGNQNKEGFRVGNRVLTQDSEVPISLYPNRFLEAQREGERLLVRYKATLHKIGPCIVKDDIPVRRSSCSAPVVDIRTRETLSVLQYAKPLGQSHALLQNPSGT